MSPRAGQRRISAQACAAATDVQPPPGERSQDELTGTAALDALHESLIHLTTPAGLHLSVKSVSVTKAMNKILAHVAFTGGETVTLRCSRERAEQFYTALGKALGK